MPPPRDPTQELGGTILVTASGVAVALLGPQVSPMVGSPPERRSSLSRPAPQPSAGAVRWTAHQPHRLVLAWQPE